MQNDWMLTPDQFKFMQQHQDAITRAYEAAQTGDNILFHQILQRLVDSQAYQTAFAKMSWDEAYDRYETMLL